MFKFLNTVEQKPKIQVKKPDFTVFASMSVHRTVDPDAMNSMVELMMCPNPRFVFSRRRGDALLARSRSIEASRFLLNTDYPVFLSLDDDISYDPLDIVKLVRLVHDEGLDIVGAPYVLKTEGGGQLTTKLLPDQNSIVLGKGGGVYEVNCVATGMMAISRRVFQKMVDESPNYPKYHPNNIPFCSTGMDKGITGFYPFFDTFSEYIEENKKTVFLSEDWGYAIKAKNLGFKVWCDSTIKLSHWGRYGYDWSDFKRPKKEDLESLVYSEKFAG